MSETPSETRFRDRDAIALDLVGVLGLVALLAGLVILRTSKELGFDPGQALNGVLSQLAVTVPAAILVLAATVLELAAGLLLARATRNRPFDSIAEALIASMVAAVIKDTFLLGTLGAFGAFRQPVLIALDVAIVLAAVAIPAISRRIRPITAFGEWRSSLTSIGSWPIAALVAIVWAGPVILQLASPVVPFVDVLPNYVGPAEHLRTFGWFSPLLETQSPIYGGSRTVLGYDGLLGAIATITNLSGGLAVSAFILPQTVLVAAGAHRLANNLRLGDTAIGPWALLAFALTQSFSRLADDRGTVVVVPLVCLGLALTADALRDPADDPWRIGRGAVIGFALGTATMVHPVIGFLAIVTVGILGLIRPTALGPTAVVATVTGGLIALPQLATMVGLSLPTLALGIGLPIAISIGIAFGVIERREAVRSALVRLAVLARVVLGVAVLAAIAIAIATAFIQIGRLPDAVASAGGLVYDASGLLLVALVVGVAAGSRGARNPLVVVGLVVGMAALVVTSLLPGNLGLLDEALRFEIPKTVHYWLATIAAVGAAAGLAHLWTTNRLVWIGRVALVGVFVAIAALPLRPKEIDAYHLGEHRWSETFAIDLRWAGSGFWVGFPDSRTIVDQPRQQILDAVRREIDAGRLAHDTPVLHLASSFQQWVATPLGVFDGVDETFVSLDPETSQHTAGGRLFGLDQLPGFLASGTYTYVVLEPDKLPPGTADQIAAAGYAPIYANQQGTLYRLGH